MIIDEIKDLMKTCGCTDYQIAYVSTHIEFNEKKEDSCIKCTHLGKVSCKSGEDIVRHLQSFDENHHVVVLIPDGDNPDIEKSIASVKFDGRNCIIKTDYTHIQIDR